jgi:hypothetical protein
LSHDDFIGKLYEVAKNEFEELFQALAGTASIAAGAASAEARALRMMELTV